MDHVLIVHAVKDYAVWKKIFDEAAPIRKEAGELNYRLLRCADDPDRVVHFSEWTSLARARAFFESPRLVAIRALAGVEAPEFLYLSQVESGTL